MILIRMRRLLVIFVLVLPLISWAQQDSAQWPGSNTVALSDYHDPEVIAVPESGEDFRQDIFLCNWNCTQTFVYGSDKFDIHNRRCIRLVEPGEQFHMPIYGKLWSVFKKTHNGLDIHLETGDSVRSMFDGKVRYAQYNKGGFGNLVIVRHNNGLETYYAHFSKLMVKPNQEVKAGEVIGLGGTSGRSKGPHLHLEVRYHDLALDPFSFIDYENRKLKSTELELTQAVFEPWNVNTVPPVNLDSLNLQVTAMVKQESGDEKKVGTLTTTSVPKTTSGKQYYTVRRGDSFYRIAMKYHTTVKELCKLNKMKSTDHLAIGKKLRVR